jgi:hypothetical protein
MPVPGSDAEGDPRTSQAAVPLTTTPVLSLAAQVRLSGPMTGEQKLGEGLSDLPLVGNPARTKDRA